MGRKRQIARKKRHATGGFFASYVLHDNQPEPFSTAIYFKMPESDCVRKMRIRGTTSKAHRIITCRNECPGCRILCVKQHPHRRWVKLESPIAIRKRLKQERIERLSKRLPVRAAG